MDSKVQLSTAAITKLVKLSIRMQLEELDSVVYAVMYQTLQKTIVHDIEPSIEAGMFGNLQNSGFVTHIDSLIKSLFATKGEPSAEGESPSTSRSEVCSSLSNKPAPELVKWLENLLPIVHSRATARGLLDAALCDLALGSKLSNPLLPENPLLQQLLNYCLCSPSVVRARLASLLVERYAPARGWLTEMVPQLLETIRCEPEEEFHLQLFVMEKYLSVVEEASEDEKGVLIVSFHHLLAIQTYFSYVGKLKGALKALRRGVWDRCIAVLSQSSCLPGVQVRTAAAFSLSVVWEIDQTPFYCSLARV